MAESSACCASLTDLPPAALERIVAAAWRSNGSAAACNAGSAGSGVGGLRALCALSATSRQLRAACDAVLASLTEVARPDWAPLRDAGAAAASPPTPAAASAAMRRLLRCMAAAARLDLGGLHCWVHDMALQTIGSSCPALEVLKLDFCQHISGNGLEAMAAGGGLRRLRELSLASCGDVGRGAFLRHLPALRVLRAPYCRSLCTEEVAGAACMLAELDLEGCDAIGDELCFFLTGSMRALNLAFLPISDVGLTAIGTNATNLQRLTLARRSMNLWVTGHYADAALAALRCARPGLTVAFTM